MKKKENQMALRTLIAGFILHFIIGSFHTWQSILRYFNSFLLEYNDTPIDHKTLELIFSISNVTHGAFMILGVLLTGYISSLKITAIGLIIRIISEYMYIVYPNIIIVGINIVICSCATGLIYLPIFLDILRYYPKSKGSCLSFALSGFGINRLMFKYISIQIIDPDSVEMIHGTHKYPSVINYNFKHYMKLYLIFYSFLSVLCVYLIYPYKPPKKNDEEGEDEDDDDASYKRKLTTDPSTIANLINIDKNFKGEKDFKEYYNETETENDEHYIRYLFNKNKNKNKNSRTKYIKEKNLNEPFSSLVISYPFIQLTFIFFFTMLIGLVELSSIRKLGTLNGHSEQVLWKTSFGFKAFNAVSMPLWGLLLDKTGFKKLYTVILTIQLIISSLCFFISSSFFGFFLYNLISALLHSVNLSIQLTTYVLIFGNEKGVLLYSISWLLIYIFYIARPYISNIFVSKIYFLMFYITLTLFTMIALIILSFFVEKKHVYIDESKKDDSSEDEKEMDDLNFDGSSEISDEEDKDKKDKEKNNNIKNKNN